MVQPVWLVLAFLLWFSTNRIFVLQMFGHRQASLRHSLAAQARLDSSGDVIFRGAFIPDAVIFLT